MFDKTFRPTEVCKALDIKKNFLISIVEKGVITPFQDAKGRGNRRLYSFRNVVEVGLFVYLTKLPLPHSMAARILQDIREYVDTTLSFEGLSYVLITGRLSGEVDMWGEPRSLNKERDRPGAFLTQYLDAEARMRPDVSHSDYCFYYIFDVANVIEFVKKRVRDL